MASASMTLVLSEILAAAHAYPSLLFLLHSLSCNLLSPSAPYKILSVIP